MRKLGARAIWARKADTCSGRFVRVHSYTCGVVFFVLCFVDVVYYLN